MAGASAWISVTVKSCRDQKKTIILVLYFLMISYKVNEIHSFFFFFFFSCLPGVFFLLEDLRNIKSNWYGLARLASSATCCQK